ncbi:MAG: DNA repair protein RecN [Dehalococcoidales bacterium]|nr:DNA repair protein RecN [Dehalococcoidales bacterium]MDD3264681.1 DNA repair protein RecN [Dehalococcoidales bacterium]MDD4322662.1 DNA repair protein RecN [Dehalococcoidales bacterium]MDD4794222.1 DNA repair protein RecN [Dehalococcoidales bacterium]MDD5121831.1 DNA repair protein RecN [Dehalococcoidales bacterium]
MELSELRINSFGIIGCIEWQPGPGLNIITGETGAGKSLIVDALDILFFSKADETVIRHGSTQATIEADCSFGCQLPAKIRELLTERGIEYDQDSLIFEAQIKKQGRSNFRVNSTPIPKSLMSRFGEIIIDMHTQAQHLTLFNPINHLEILDAFGNVNESKKHFEDKLAALHKLLATKSFVEKEVEETERKRDFLNYQVKELTDAELKTGEEADLEAELQTLASAERIHELGQRLNLVLNGGADSYAASALDACGQGIELSRQLTRLDASFSQIADELEKITTNLQDLSHEIVRYVENIDVSGARLEEVEIRLGLLKTLKKKYNRNIEGLIAFRDETLAQLQNLENIPINLKRLEHEIEQTKAEMAELATEMHRLRKEAAKNLESSVNRELLELDMNSVVFSVLFEDTQEDPEGLPDGNGRFVAYNKNGTDKIIFTASTNPGEPQKPLHSIASTGEASRFTLAIKNALAQTDSVPVLIFDEIDIGVGGRSGEIIGKKLWALARHHQVICITHLPQIAAFADNHYRVTKEGDGDRNTSNIMLLGDDEKLKELAEMLSSKNYSSEAVQAARELYRMATDWKNKQPA